MTWLGLREGDARPLVVRGDRTVTRSDLAIAAGRLAAHLRAHACQRAMVCTDDPVTLLTALEGCSASGTSLTIAHTSLTDAQRSRVIAATASTMLIDETGAHHTLVDVASSESSPASAEIVMMTSGSTGDPKLVARSRDSLLTRMLPPESTGAAAADRWLLTYQTTGFAGMQVLLTAVRLGEVLVVPEARTPQGFYAAAVAGQVTQISGTPTFWRSLLMLVRPGDLALRQVTLGGEATDQTTLDRLKRTFPGARITHTYASTEAGLVYAVHDGMAGFPQAWLGPSRRGVELRVVDGFLHVRSTAAMQRYLADGGQPILDDGWLRTADRCELRGDRVHVLGREDAMINVAGTKVYPPAVEAVLIAHPSILDAHVYGVSNPVAGALVGADVVLEPGTDAVEARTTILAACRATLAPPQVPRILRFVERLDVAASGKRVLQ